MPGVQPIVVFTHAAHKPPHNNACCPLPKIVGPPLFTVMAFQVCLIFAVCVLGKYQHNNFIL
jgi:hypothetical protein